MKFFGLFLFFPEYKSNDSATRLVINFMQVSNLFKKIVITKLQDLCIGLQSSGPGLSLIVLRFWARHNPLSTQVHKWLLANLMLRVTLQCTSIPSRGGGGR